MNRENLPLHTPETFGAPDAHDPAGMTVFPLLDAAPPAKDGPRPAVKRLLQGDGANLIGPLRRLADSARRDPEPVTVDRSPGAVGTFAAPRPWPGWRGQLPTLAVAAAWATDIDERTLSEAERDSADRIAHPASRAHYVGARGVVRRLVAGWLGVAPVELTIGRRCPRCGGDHGPPHVPGAPLSISVTHSGGLVLCAVAAAGGVGVDVEEVRALPPEIVPLILSPEDLQDEPAPWEPDRLLSAWVRKEAVTKLTGAGLTLPFACLALRAVERQYLLVRLDGQLPTGYTGALAADAAAGPVHWLELPPT